MDMMKTLLIYLSATMALAVQSTSAPKETPAPTPAPTAIVETADSGEDTGEPAVTAAPAETATQAPSAGETVKPTPVPVPTITPNLKGYRNLGMGAKGKEVRKLQEKLIEMKYLPEGAADGAYGRQTYNAVRKFQYYNGLKQDGVAGRATQTNLFENPEIVPNPEAKDETPVPETTPEATAETAPETETGAAAEGTENAGTEEAATEESSGTAEEEKASEMTAVPPEMLDQYMGTQETDKTSGDAQTAERATEQPAEKPAEKPAEATAAEPAGTEATEPAEKPEEEAGSEPTEKAAEAVGESKAETAETREEIVENVDLDADVYESITGSVALNEGTGPLEFVAKEDGVPVTARPRLAQNGAKIRVSLDDLCQCAEGWRLTDDGVGTIVLEAAGYTLAIYNEASGCSATVDGTEVSMKDDDMDFSAEGHFINAEFLASALKGEAEWEPEESTLMLRIHDKADGEHMD